jgi:hypothetical protein
VAVIQPFKVESWIQGVREPPRKILRQEGNLQVVEVEALDAVVGRVKRQNVDNRGGEVQIIHDISMGMLRG